MLGTIKTMTIITVIISSPMGEIFFVKITIPLQLKLLCMNSYLFHQYVSAGWKCVLSLSFTTAVDQSR